MAGIKQNGIRGGCCGIPGWCLPGISHEDSLVRIDMTDEEPGHPYRVEEAFGCPASLWRLRSEAIVYAWRGVGLDTVAEMVERAEETVREWLSRWRRRRLVSVVTGHAVGESAARPRRAQKDDVEETLRRPPSEAGVRAGPWGARGSLRMSRLIRSRYGSDSS